MNATTDMLFEMDPLPIHTSIAGTYILYVQSFFSFRVRVAWSSRPPCSIVAGYACSHPCMVFIRVVSLLDVGLVFVGSLENSWLVVVIRLSCVWIEVHSSSTCCWVSSFRPHPLHIVFVYMFL